MKLYQFSCFEGKNIDMRQANAVLKYRPDIIIFEAPCNEKTPDLIYNKFSPSKKPQSELIKYKEMLHKVAKKFSWVESDIYVYDNIATLWKEGHDIKLYNVDGPSELLKINLKFDDKKYPKPYRRGTHFVWWVRIYIREKIMTKNVQWILSHYKNKKDFTGLVFLESFHWRNVKFQLSKPPKKQMWNYYFGNFRDLNQKNIGSRIKENNKLLYKYWLKYSEFK